MAWIWSDELATRAGAEGIEDDRLSGWARRPVAFWLSPGDDEGELVRRLLGLEPSVQESPKPGPVATLDAPPRICNCASGPIPEVLAPTAAAG